MSAANRQAAPKPGDMRALLRACEDLRAPHQALLMASSGVSAAMHAHTATPDGVFWLLEAVGHQFDAAITTLEALLEMKTHE